MNTDHAPGETEVQSEGVAHAPDDEVPETSVVEGYIFNVLYILTLWLIIQDETSNIMCSQH